MSTSRYQRAHGRVSNVADLSELLASYQVGKDALVPRLFVVLVEVKSRITNTDECSSVAVAATVVVAAAVVVVLVVVLY